MNCKSWVFLGFYRSDSNVSTNRRLIDVVDDSWRKEKFAKPDISIPDKLTQDGDLDVSFPPMGIVEDEENKWLDLATERMKIKAPK